MTTVFGIQRRMMQLGRVRLGEKGKKGEPKKLDTFRLTSASRGLLESAAEQYGGKVRDWKDAPDEGYYELTTEATELPIVIPPVYADSDGSPTLPYRQFYELWSGGGCQRRCDGRTEFISGGDCRCNPEARECEIVTRLNFILPELPGIGVWRLDTGGMNAAFEIPGTLEFLALRAAEGEFIRAILRVEKRTSKAGGVTRRYVVPVIDVPDVSIGELLPGDERPMINPPRPRLPKPELPAGPGTPAEPESTVAADDTPFGEPPEIPGESLPSGDDTVTPPSDSAPPPKTESAPPGKAPTVKQLTALDALVGKLRDAGHITTEMLWIATDRTPEPGEDGQVHWSDLRDQLNREEASALLTRLIDYEKSLA